MRRGQLRLSSGRGGRWVPWIVRLWMVGVAVVIGGVAAFFIWMGAAERDRALAAQAWPTVPGTITESRVAESRGAKGRRESSAIVRYTYAVDGTSYEGNRLSFIVATDSAASRVARFRQGDRVEVHVNPNDPTTAVLEAPPPGWEAWIPIAVGTFGVFFCTCFAILAWQMSGMMINPERTPGGLLRLFIGRRRLQILQSALLRRAAAPTIPPTTS